MTNAKRHAKRIAIGIIGGLVLIIGIIAIPYPGPGWLIVFAGLAILSTEFDWAQRVLDYARGKYDAWQEWLKRQSLAIRAGFWLLTCAVVITTIYLLNGYGFINDMLNLGWDWLRSPLPFFY
jgi:uncharacterized protein (TIGR02611 family)